MIRATVLVPAGRWCGVAADRVVLAYEDRHRRRIAMQGEGGLMFLLDLAPAIPLHDGDAPVLEDGRIVEVRARPEALLDVRGRDAHHLTRLAWHLGNRHVPAAIEPHRVLIRADPVIAEMLAGLGAEVSAVEAAFDPEGGAYVHASGPAPSIVHGHDQVPARGHGGQSPPHIRT